MGLNPDALSSARTLWEYHCASKLPDRAVELVIALGSHDLRVAEYAASVSQAASVKIMVISGGAGKITSDLWGETEAAAFARIAVDAGIDSQKILIETESTNTTDNFVYSKRLVLATDTSVSNGIIITKPYMMRRAWAVAMKQWPELTWFVDSPRLSFEAYPNADVPLDRMVNLMVGDLQRIKVYADKGFQIPQTIPDDVWRAYEDLVSQGYDRFVIK